MRKRIGSALASRTTSCRACLKTYASRPYPFGARRHRVLRTITRRDSAESSAEKSLILASSAAGGSEGTGPLASVKRSQPCSKGGQALIFGRHCIPSMSFIYSKTSGCTLSIKYILRTCNGRPKRHTEGYTEVKPPGSFF